MRYVVWFTLAIVASLGILIYNILNTSLVNYPGLVIALPICLALFITSTYLLIKSIFTKQDYSRKFLIQTTRQGLLLGVVLALLLYLQGLRVLSTLDSILLIAAAIVLELFFQSEKIDQRTPKQ